MLQDDTKYMHMQFTFHITNLMPNKSRLCEKYFLDILVKEYILHRFMNLVAGFTKEMTRAEY